MWKKADNRKNIKMLFYSKYFRPGLLGLEVQGQVTEAKDRCVDKTLGSVRVLHLLVHMRGHVTLQSGRSVYVFNMAVPHTDWNILLEMFVSDRIR